MLETHLVELCDRALEVFLGKIVDEVPYLPKEGRLEHVSSRTLAKLDAARAPGIIATTHATTKSKNWRRIS